ncbi:MAG: hypoxanthine phosphoribosyltransferase [Lachnospiraceae bacterium]|nr:hypoxanthine phosphoribosyltransferase [Lachnospiraceae bacterium]
MGYTIKEMISQEKLEGRIKELGAQISKDYEGKSVHLICILKGSAFFACELAKYITVPVTMDFMQCSSYGADTQSSGVVKLAKDLDETITGKNVIVIEDIIDTGRTLSHLVTLLKHRDPASLVLCTLLDKPERRVVDDVNVDYVGFQIPDEFVVGYGLDYAQNHRNLSYIGVVEFDS